MTGPHWIIVPIVLPLLVGALAIVLERRARAALWPLSLLTVLALAAVNLGLLERASGGTIEAYLLGNWRAPFGIALALDRLAALMLSLTTLVALASLLYARGKEEFEGAVPMGLAGWTAPSGALVAIGSCDGEVARVVRGFRDR